MKTWLTLGLVVIVCFFVYSVWFTADDPEDSVATQPILLAPEPVAVESEDPPPETEEEPVQDPRSLRLDLGDARLPAGRAATGKGEEEAWGLYQAREKALADGQSVEAGKLADRILKEHPFSDAACGLHFERGKQALYRYREIGRNPEGIQQAQKARQHLTPVLFARRADVAEKEQLRRILAELARTVLLNNRHMEGVDRTYRVKSGDQLGVLCRKLFPQWGARVTPGFVCYVNNLPSPKDLRAHEPIKVPLGEPSIVVVKSEFRLYFLFAGVYVTDFRVGLGREDSTPEMAFEIGDKLKKPDWYPRPGVKIPYGDPRNILGTRWLEFKDTESYRG
ncbi:MAG: L,D-transpeptidase, partial [Planctomycetota bacterium]